MSDVNTQETNKQSGLTSALLLGGTLIGGLFFAAPFVVAHFALTAVVAAGAGIYAASSESRREKTKSLFSKVTGAYKDAFSNLSKGWSKATKWAEAKEAAAKQAPEATGGASPLASKEAGSDFNAAANDDVKVKASAPAPAAKPTARPGM